MDVWLFPVFCSFWLINLCYCPLSIDSMALLSMLPGFHKPHDITGGIFPQELESSHLDRDQLKAHSDHRALLLSDKAEDGAQTRTGPGRGSNGKFPKNGGGNGKVIYKWWIVNRHVWYVWYVWLLEGNGFLRMGVSENVGPHTMACS